MNIGGLRAKTAARRLALLGSALALGLAAAVPTVHASSEEDLVRQLADPIASLVSVPFQNNWEGGIGPRSDGDRYRLNLQRVIPFDLNDDWSLISRVILPLVSQRDMFPGAGSMSGLVDTLASLFLALKRPTAGGSCWGIGLVFLVPTGTDELLTGKKWGLGPTGVVLTQVGPWTYGVLGNPVWSVEVSSSRPNVSSTFV
jgi:hypothetical protein